MDRFCSSPFWQHNLTWETTGRPDFTPCFQETLLIWLPCITLWILAPLELVSIYKSERKYIPSTLLNQFKTFLTIVLLALTLIELVEPFLTTTDDGASISNYVSPIIRALTYVLVIVLITIHRNRGVHTSGLMFSFWLLMSIASVINFRSLIISTFHDHQTDALYPPIAEWNLSELRYTLRLVSTPIVIVQLVLSCIADKKAHDPFMLTGEDYRNQSPENDASILSQITFWWLNSLMLLGYKRSLTQEDLYAVRPQDRTERATYEFEKLINPAIQKALEDNRIKALSAQENLLKNKNGKPDGQGRSRLVEFLPLLNKQRYNSLGASRPNENGQSESRTGQEPEEVPQVGVANLLIKAYWPRFILASSFKLIANLLTFASPILLGKLINFVSSNTEPSWRGYFYAFALFLLSMIQSIFDNREQYLTNTNVMLVKTCLTAATYGKTLRLSNQGRKRYTTGEIVNLMSVDTQKIADFVSSVNSLWSAPMQLTISMIMLYQQLGVAIFAGLAVMIVNIPLNRWITQKLGYYQKKVMHEKDKRIKLLSEMINGIKIIKIHAWEESFRQRTEAIRASEIANLIKQIWYSAFITFAFTSLPFFVALASFATFVLIDSNNVLDASTAFVSLSLFNIIRFPLAILPLLLQSLALFKVSLRRMNKFLESEETDPDAIQPIDDDSNVINIRNGTFKWEITGENVLENINLEIPRRKLIAVVGPVGSGKSSLLSAILGDLEKSEGQVMFDKDSSLAYVPQEAWILNTTIRDNIMFNKVINEDRYQRVLDACALRPDLQTLEDGELSEIGEKGINLSGGQKQRVSLARAVYADTDIYLLDDPLNAVDAHVGRHIFDNIIGPKGMLRDRTRVLVTNKLSVLPEVDHIIVLKDGKISESGTYERLLKDRGLFSQLLIRYLIGNTDNTEVSEGTQIDVITKELQRMDEQQARKARESTPKKEIKTESKSISQLEMTSKGKKTRSGNDGIEPHKRGLTGQEVTQVGSVGLNVHMNFIRTMGINFMIALVIYVLSSVFTLSSNLWLSAWSNDALNETLRNSTAQRDLRLGVYAGLGLGESICVITSTILLNIACIKSSQTLHNRMLSRVLRAPVSWFNTTPSGRIMNRFSKDVDTVDVNIRFNVRLLMVIALRSVTSLILISIGSAYSIILIIPIVLLYFLFQMFYIATSRQLKRIQSTTTSPIFSHFTETIVGTSSIRAFGVTQEFILESNHRLDVNNASYYISFVAARWLAIRLEFLGFIVVLTAALIAAVSRGLISPGIAGLTVTYSLTVTQVLSFLVRTYSDYETNVVSIERLLEYTRTPVEPEDDEVPTDPNWPAKGQITYDNFSARYRPELELVLNKFNLKVDPTEKVGLVGRTGAGKSSVTLALFRILEAAEGRIVIDGVDISHINLRLLRSKLSIIPQEPILFTGTIRQNIDPTESYSDEEIWRSIDLAHLGDYLRTLPAGLEHQVAESGNNFSVGQKQLFCLARTLLRRSKILVLDEATAAVDVETDNLIQRTIRKEFKDSTILTVAHRLETIQDYDRVVVMDKGQTVEQGKPSNLLKDRSSKYYAMAHESSAK
uniref:ABC-type glutathione-S-conjugate transporter n=1 Tax=Aceria tosichella TaxID=561515 RepID=A0A6G1SHL7_9ACAR